MCDILLEDFRVIPIEEANALETIKRIWKSFIQKIRDAITKIREKVSKAMEKLKNKDKSENNDKSETKREERIHVKTPEGEKVMTPVEYEEYKKAHANDPKPSEVTPGVPSSEPKSEPTPEPAKPKSEFSDEELKFCKGFSIWSNAKGVNVKDKYDQLAFREIFSHISSSEFKSKVIEKLKDKNSYAYTQNYIKNIERFDANPIPVLDDLGTIISAAVKLTGKLDDGAKYECYKQIMTASHSVCGRAVEANTPISECKKMISDEISPKSGVRTEISDLLNTDIYKKVMGVYFKNYPTPIEMYKTGGKERHEYAYLWHEKYGKVIDKRVDEFDKIIDKIKTTTSEDPTTNEELKSLSSLMSAVSGAAARVICTYMDLLDMEGAISIAYDDVIADIWKEKKDAALEKIRSAHSVDESMSFVNLIK